MELQDSSSVMKRRYSWTSLQVSPPVPGTAKLGLAKGCPSSGWCLCLIGVHNWEMGLLDPRIAADLWEQDPNARFSSSYAPFGSVQRVEGGYELSGHWPWSSGCDHGTWVNVGFRAAEGEEPLPPMSALVPRADYEQGVAWWRQA